MCGIAGFLSKPGAVIEKDVIGKSMLKALQHRGHDGEGIWCDDSSGVLLGHRRLSIQDLSELGAQPMLSKSGRYCIVFNGEIYNFKEIRSELKKIGVEFRGQSDSEVLVEAIDQWGLIQAINLCVGMFAFAVWDIKRKKLYLCRDRIGEKPLYYGMVGKTFYFASELKAIETVVQKKELKIEQRAVHCFLKYGYINAPLSIYQGIKKLIPGTIIKMDIDNIFKKFVPAPEPYWEVVTVAENGINRPVHTDVDATDQLDDLLIKTIERQLISDVPVGTFLSGGIDSSLVSAIAQNVSRKKIKTFTIGFNDEQYDESRFAEKIASHIGSDHHSVYVSSRDALNVIPELSSIYDEPFADSSQVPTYLVSKIAKQEVTVCLSGDGGDELFSGYNRYMWLGKVWNSFHAVPVSVRKKIGKILSLPSPYGLGKIYSLINNSHDQEINPELITLRLQKIVGLLQQDGINDGYDYLLSYWDKPNIILNDNSTDDFSIVPDYFPSGASFIERAMYWDQVSYLPGDNLAKVDRASMRVGLETRLPLLSHEVIEYSWRLPISSKVKGSIGKLPLRNVLERYVPSQLIDRPKMGFSVPLSGWLKGELREWAEELITSSASVDLGLFNNDVLLSVWERHLSGKYDYSHKIWTILMLISWLQSRDN